MTAARVLVVEDNRVNLELMAYLLGAFGYEAITALDGGVGLDRARRDPPDLILCDIQMPGIDGFEFARLVRQDPALRDLPLVAVTAYAMVGDRDRVLAAGFDGYISKPIEPAEFIATIRPFLPEQMRGADAPSAPAQALQAAPLARPTTILVLDDTPSNLEFKRGLFEPYGYTVVTAGTMDAALAAARASRPDLILSDVGMRDGSGFDFIARVKTDPALRDVPFIFLSSTHWDEGARARGLDLGAVRYLLRPIDAEALLAEVRSALATCDGPADQRRP